MVTKGSSRRVVLAHGAAALAGLAMLRFTIPAEAFPARPGEAVVPWLDPRTGDPPPEIVGEQIDWEQLDSWITPHDKFFWIAHYGRPAIAAADWRLEVGGLVEHPLTLSLDDLRARPRQEVTFTIECSGNTSNPAVVTGLVGNATWAGTPLAPLLREAGLREGAQDVVFWGTDTGEETYRDMKVTEQFARSMAPADALSPNTLLAYEMNGQPLPVDHGFPLRLIAPGWYGVANVKWLRRIEARADQFEGKFMGRDYVTMREEQRDGKPVVVYSSVGRARLKSAPAKVTLKDGAHRIVGAAWGASIARVEVRVDDGPWEEATLEEGAGGEFAWVFWYKDWPSPAAGEHAITSRATDTAGNVQPAPSDPVIANKKTFWEANGHVTRRVGIGSYRRPAARPSGLGADGRPVSGRLDAGGHVAVHPIAYPGDLSVYTIKLQVRPDLPELLERAGFRVYGPVSEKVYVTGGAQPGLRPNVSGNLISRDRGEYTVQVYNDHPTLAVDYELNVTPDRPDGR